MIKDLRKETLLLVKDVLKYLDLPFKAKKTFIASSDVKEPIQDQVLKIAPKMEAVKKPIIESKITKSATKESLWHLSPPKLFTDIPEYSSFSECFTYQKLPVPVRIYTNCEGEEIFFFENVARAITRTMIPTAVLFTNELKLPMDLSLKLLLIQISLLRPSFPDANVHVLFQKDHYHILPLCEVNEYLNNLELKRTLWNILKTHLQSLLQFS